MKTCFPASLLLWALLLIDPVHSAEKPNVLFIAVDDMNDWTTLYHPDNPIKTPNLRHLASRGVFFSHAYCASPACNPSRVATLTGLHPTRSGVYGNKSDWRKAHPKVVTLPQHFIKHGYHAVGAGKIYHHHFDSVFHDDASFHDFRKLTPHPWPPKRLNGITNWVGGRDGGPTARVYDWGPWPPRAEDTPDAKTVDYALDYLAKSHEKPFFLAVGIFRPHSPFFAPPEFFERYPSDALATPPTKEDDLNDLPSGGRKMLEDGKPFLYQTMAAHKQWPQAVRAYMACSSFADAQIGRLLAGLERSPYHKNTIIVLWSDHGFHLGEKKHWEKFTLWEKATRCPLIVVAPDQTQAGTRCQSPVSLLDLYPTLVDLCGLEKRLHLDGVSLRPLLKDPKAQRGRPVLTTWGRGNHSVRSQNWRFIQYADGSRELYDHTKDPNEWTNVAGDAGHTKTIASLRRHLPQLEAEPVSDLILNQPQE